jgi:hypothetical protein
VLSATAPYFDFTDSKSCFDITISSHLLRRLYGFAIAFVKAYI